MLNAKITGIASYLPNDVLDNEMLSQMVDTNDEWITTRVGVKERRILKKPVGSSWMGIQAVNKLLEETGTNRDDIDLLICPTSNPDHRFPSTASIIAHGVGIEKKAYAYDIQAACAGFLVGLYEATAFIRAGIGQQVDVALLGDTHTHGAALLGTGGILGEELLVVDRGHLVLNSVDHGFGVVQHRCATVADLGTGSASHKKA